MLWSRFGCAVRASLTRPLAAAAAATTLVAPLAVRTSPPAGASPSAVASLLAHASRERQKLVLSCAEAFWARKPMSSTAGDSHSPLQDVSIKMFQYEICPFCNKVVAPQPALLSHSSLVVHSYSHSHSRMHAAWLSCKRSQKSS